MGTYRGDMNRGARSSALTHGEAPYAFAMKARRSLTPLERRFDTEKRRRWKTLHWHRYAPITIQAHPEHKSTWFAPFVCVEKKVVVVIEDRHDFPYRIFGQNRALYARHGYTILDFSEDTSCPIEGPVWEEMMALINSAVEARDHAPEELGSGRRVRR
jgi:very-short-patch-repair endonuclease